MGRNSIDIRKRLTWVANACNRTWKTQATVEETQRGVPYVKVGNGDVRVVIFARTRNVRVFFKRSTGEQAHMDFKMDVHASWIGHVAAFACGASHMPDPNT